jgi:hypothetical protein
VALRTKSGYLVTALALVVIALVSATIYSFQAAPSTLGHSISTQGVAITASSSESEATMTTSSNATSASTVFSSSNQITTTMSTPASSTSTSNSSDGLRLSLTATFNSTYGNVTVTVEEFNTLNSVNNVTEANAWRYPATSLNPLNNCPPTHDPVGVGIFAGYYSMNNYTSGQALPVYNTDTEYTCTINFQLNRDSFQPMSDSFLAINNGPSNSTAFSSISTDGYWTGGGGGLTPATFNVFRPGVYTAIGADTWGNLLLLHFVVP